jgi:hypothetical protein
VLSLSGGSWDSPPASVKWNTTQLSILNYILKTSCASNVWGFKDPRSILCLHGWLDTYPNLELVSIFRHPLEVASSLAARNGFSLDFGMELWFMYNTILFNLVVAKSLPLLLFDSDLNRFKCDATILIKHLDLPLRPSVPQLAFYDPNLRNHNSHNSSLPPHIDTLYLKLLNYYKNQSIFQSTKSQINIFSSPLILINKLIRKP